jgi:hypothetical protein
MRGRLTPSAYRATFATLLHRQFTVCSVFVDLPAAAGHGPTTMVHIIWIVLRGQRTAVQHEDACTTPL